MTMIHVPITALYAGLHGLLFAFLTILVVRQRLALKVNTGDGGDPGLRRAIRVHGNFAEYVPIALVLILVLELAGADRLWLHALGGALFIARTGHAIGLLANDGSNPPRAIGFLLTWLVIAVAAVMCLWYAFMV